MAFPSAAAEVFVDIGSGLCLTYLVPPSLSPKVLPGARVLVPLSGRKVPGIVLRAVSPPPGRKFREIMEVIEPGPVCTSGLVELAESLAKYYLCSFPRALKSVIPASVRQGRRTREVTLVRLSIPPAEASVEASLLAKRAPRQAALLRVLSEAGDEPVAAGELFEQAGASPSSLRALVKRNLVALEKVPARVPLPCVVPSRPLDLTKEQSRALAGITGGIERKEFGIFLLHGITGSGKTEIYLQAISRVLDKGKGAIVLVPEISLTPQTSERFRARFGDRVEVIHSGLAEGERAEAWRRICARPDLIVLGPRSAVFSPLTKPGIIVVDEEHETSYKQYDSAPFYHARDVALLRARLEGIPVVLGSATPSLESYHNARHGHGELLVLRTRPRAAILPRVRIVDMRRETERAGRPVTFSQELLKGMADCLDQGGQCILFINRRGFNTAAVCRDCGHVVRCRHCSIALTHHRRKGRLVCHLCGYEEAVPRRCALCRSTEISLRGLGTERVEDQIARCFPGIPIGRMDADTVSRRGAHEKFLSRFKRGETRILVGTQMIAKGLDFPGVTLVGVVFADTALNLADFRAAEYTFQILTQVAGRSGRGDREGEVVIQTYNPRHPALLAAARQDYEAFYREEIKSRSELGFPPLVHLISLTVSSRNEAKSEAVAGYLAERLAPRLPPGSDLLGPSPPPVERIRGRFRWQLILRGRKVLPLTEAVAEELKEIPLERGVRVEVDVDPVSML